METHQATSDKQKVAELITRLKERFGDDDELSQEAMTGTFKYVIYVRRSLTKKVQNKQTHSRKYKQGSGLESALLI